jgi:hypothetical protein
MDNNIKQPKNIFEQILFGQEIVNDNIVALADNLVVVNDKLDILLDIFSPSQINKDSEPDASGAETMQTIGGI